jgi:CRISPR-associated protein Csd1
VYLFWTREQTEFAFASMLSNPQPDEVRELIRSAFSGQRAATAMDVIPFYATAFSASGGRLAVREWITTTLAETQGHLAQYFALQNIVRRDGIEPEPMGLNLLIAELVPRPTWLRRNRNWKNVELTLAQASRVVRQTKDLSPQVPKVLLRLALHGGPLPMSLLFQAVRRNRAEQRIGRPRAALIKMVLLSQQAAIEKEDAMVQLDPENRNPAYLCGRLLAVLEAVQRAALPRINATITDRFFGTASSAPALVFGRLLRGAQPHLMRLRRDRPGLHHFWQRRIEEVMAGLEGFPKTLTLEEQGIFALGYYHQRAYRPPNETESDDNEGE